MISPPVSPDFQGLIETHGRNMGEVQRKRGVETDVSRSHLKPRIPVVLQGAFDHWPARTKWTFDYFREQYGHIEVPIGVVFAQKERKPLGEYIDYLQSLERGEVDGLPQYMEGWYFRFSNPELLKDFEVPAAVRKDWFERFFPDRWNPKGTGILMGPKGAFTKLHTDGQCTHTWLAQLVGRKRWVLVDFDQLEDVFQDKAESNGFYPGLEHPALAGHPRLSEIEYWTCTLEPGELIVLPGNWYHQVESLDNTISLTHNFFNGTNAPRVLWELMCMRIGDHLGRGKV